MKTVSPKEFDAAPIKVGVPARAPAATTPMAMMLRSYRPATQMMIAGAALRDQMRDAAQDETHRAVELGQRAAALMMQPVPPGPFAGLVKMGQMQDLMLRHASGAAQRTAERLSAAREPGAATTKP